MSRALRRPPAPGVEWEFDKVTFSREFSRNVVTKLLVERAERGGWELARVHIDYLSHQQPWETPYDGALVDAMTRSILAEDDEAIVAPYLMSGGTDAKHFRKLGMRSYGFAPLRLPSDLDFTALFHGVDERVPVDALEFGARVFDRFLDDV